MIKKYNKRTDSELQNTHNRVASSQGDGTQVPTVVPLKPPRCCGEDHTHCAHGTRHPQPGVLQPQFFRVLSERLPADFMVYHGLSWFIIIILGLYNVVSTSISRYTHHIFRAISGRSNNPIPWRYSVMVSGENWDLLNQSGDLTNSARRRSWDILGYIYWWFMVIHPMQWESYENIQPR